jgi:DNA-directed RNA polymerase specialized sigma24 family protein
MRLTTGTVGSRWSVEEDEVSGASVPAEHNIITGVELTNHMLAYLDESLRGRSLAQRLEHLEEVDKPAYDAYERRRKGETLAEIADAMQCSQSTVQRALGRAKRAMGTLLEAVSPEGLTYNQRMEILRHRAPNAAEVYEFRSYGWDLEAIAHTMGISLSAVKRLSVKAREWMGEIHREGERTRRRMAWIGRQDDTDVPLTALTPAAQAAIAVAVEVRCHERGEFDQLTNLRKPATVELPEGVTS